MSTTTVRLNASTLVEVTSTSPYSRTPWSELPDVLSFIYISGATRDSTERYIKYSALDNQYKNKIVEQARVYYMAQDGTTSLGSSSFPLLADFVTKAATEDWDDDTICYENAPSTERFSSNVWAPPESNEEYAYCYGTVAGFTEDFDDYEANRTWMRNLLDNGALIYALYVYSDSSRLTAPPKLKHRGSANIPYIEIDFSDSTSALAISSCSPSSGFQAKYSANTYSWGTTPSDFSITDPTIANAYFRYRADSSSAYTEVDCGAANSYTMPASTISTDSFQWQVSITDSNGHTATSDWFTISTVETLSTAKIVYPKNTSIVGSQINRFEWEHIISTGSAQTKADLQYSSDSGTTWTDLATVTGSALYKDVAANTFSAGTYMWRVRTYNTDDNYGSWSDTKSFTVVAKPNVYAVASEQTPKPKITWQTDGQQAYRVTIGDLFDSGVVFGTTTNYTLPIYLDDGSYTASVIVQNSYGLWSNPGTAPITVTHTAGTSMVLTAVVANEGTTLTWTAVATYACYVVYRDGIAIEKTTDTTFTDYTSIGSHAYYIRGIYASSANYGLSNTLTVSNSTDELMIIDLETKTSLSIQQNDSSFAELIVVDTVNNTEVYVSAADYPINEVSHFKRKSIGFDCAFVRDSANALVFRAMLGQLVCIRTPSGTSVVGNLLEQTRSENWAYEKYECTLEQTNYEEEIQL